MFAHRIANELGAVAHAELGQHAAAVILGGFRADIEPLRDFLDRQAVDDEVQRIVAEEHTITTALLTEHRSQLDSLAERLLQAETLDEAEAYEAAGVERIPTPVEMPKAETAAAQTRTVPT